MAERKKLLLTFFVFIILFGAYQFIKKKGVENNGIYTKATLINSEGYKGGIFITVNYEYLGKQFSVRINGDLGKGAIGRQYFIQFKPENLKSIVFHEDKPVPDCLTNAETPDQGWKQIPSCP